MQRVKSFGVESVAKMLGIMYAGMGLIFMPFFLIAAAFGKGNNSGVFGIAFAILLPVFYGVLGYLTGAFSAWFYNLIAGTFGGIVVKLEVERQSSNGGLIG